MRNPGTTPFLVRGIAFLLVIVPFVLYLQVMGHSFVEYDDNLYVTGNPRVQAGLDSQSLRWAFTATDASNWHPLTWLSHLLDVRLYGLNPAGHHLTNLLFHAANTLLLFLALARMTGTAWQSGFVAALFALHPLHVESVAWVAERKDVLSAFFWMLTMWAYVDYAKRPSAARYIPCLVFFALGLMAKPMLVTLPFVLLLLDHWPLARMKEHRISRLVAEKVPFLFLSAVSSAVTLMVQKAGNAMALHKLVPLNTRAMNAAVSYVTYLGETIWPAGLSVFYPHPLQSLPLWPVLGGGLLLVLITLLVLRNAKRRGYFATGWFWYLGTLVPVIGLVQVGEQAHADRYTYIPLTGLFIMIAWGVPDLLRQWRYRKTALSLSAAIVLCACSILTWRQLGTWHDTASLFEHAKRVTRNNHIAHRGLAQLHDREGRLAEAAIEYQALIGIDPEDMKSHNNLGLIYGRQGRSEEAARELNTAYAIGHFEQGLAEVSQGRFDEARRDFRRAMELRPDYAETRYRRGVDSEKRGRLEDAIAQYQAVVFLNPEFAEARHRLGLAFLAKSRYGEAVQEMQFAVRLDPGNTEARKDLETALASRSK